MIRRLAAAPLALLAGCGDPPAATNAAAAAVAPTADYAATIRTLPEGQRTAVFLRAIRDAGRDCQTVTAATEVTGEGGVPTWQAICDDGNHWLVAISPNGTATVTNRTQLRTAQQ